MFLFLVNEEEVPIIKITVKLKTKIDTLDRILICDIQAERQTEDRQTDRQKNRQTDRHTIKQIGSYEYWYQGIPFGT